MISAKITIFNIISCPMNRLKLISTHILLHTINPAVSPLSHHEAFSYDFFRSGAYSLYQR